jgi:hypothetical protein
VLALMQNVKLLWIRGRVLDLEGDRFRSIIRLRVKQNF